MLFQLKLNNKHHQLAVGRKEKNSFLYFFPWFVVFTFEIEKSRAGVSWQLDLRAFLLLWSENVSGDIAHHLSHLQPAPAVPTSRPVQDGLWEELGQPGVVRGSRWALPGERAALPPADYGGTQLCLLCPHRQIWWEPGPHGGVFQNWQGLDTRSGVPVGCCPEEGQPARWRGSSEETSR